MQPSVDSFDNVDNIRTLINAKIKYGMIYGIFTGLAFAVAAWGMDGYSLSQAHALFPWMKLVLGSVICAGLGGLAGRIAASIDKVYMALLIWLATLAIFGWLSLELPFQLVPTVTLWLKPALKGLLQFPFYPDFQTRLGIVLVWTLIIGFIVGILQLPTSESAVFSISIFGKITPVVISAILMIIAGTVVDSFNNEPFRTAITSVDSVIQYTLDHQGQTIDPQIKSQLHLSILNNIEDLVNRSRRLVVANYDSSLREVQVIVEFRNTSVECLTVYGQPSFCEKVTATAP
jgi:hypothetical protein